MKNNRASGVSVYYKHILVKSCYKLIFHAFNVVTVFLKKKQKKNILLDFQKWFLKLYVIKYLKTSRG